MQNNTQSHHYKEAKRIGNLSLRNMIEQNLINNESGAVSLAISDKMKAHATRISETFDMLNLISAIPVIGNYAAYKYGEANDRSSDDIHYFTGYSGSKKNTSTTKARSTGKIPLKSGGRIIGNLDTASYTSMSEGKDQKFRRGDGLAELLARQLNLMKKYHNENVKHIKEIHEEELKRRKEADTWEKNLLRAVLGGGGGGDKPPPEGGTDPLTVALSAASGAATTYVGKRIRDYIKSKRAAKKATLTEEKPTTKKMVEEEPQPKKSAQKLRQQMTDEEFSIKRNQELKSQGKLNREQRRAQVRKEIKQRNASKKALKESLARAKKVVPETRTEIQPPKSSTAVEGVEKSLGKFAAKRAARYLAEDVPVIGAIIATGFAANRAYNGDWTGAGMELGLAAAATLAPLSLETAAPLIMAGQIALTARDFERQLEENKKINDKWQKDADAAKLLGEPIPPKPTTVFDLISDDVSKIGTSKRGYKSNQVSAPIPQPNTVSQNVTKAIETNRKVKMDEKTKPLKVNVIDKHKTFNSVGKPEDSVSIGKTFNVRNDEDTFAWISDSNCRRV